MMDGIDAPTPPPVAADARAVPPATAARLWRSAEDFAAVALGELLSPMFDTLDGSGGPFGGGAGEAAFKPMLVSEIAKGIARGGGLGLTAPVYQQMLRLQEKGR